MFGKYNYERANQLHDAGEYDKAIPKYIKAIESGDLDADEIYFSFVFLASCCTTLGDYDSAIVNLDKALEWNNDNARVYYEYGRVYWKQSDYDSALPYLEDAINRDSKDILSWDVYGLCLTGVERHKEAIIALERALELAIKEKSGLVDEIEIEINKAKADFATQKGDKYFEEKKFEAALEKYNQALDLNLEIIDKDDDKVAEIHRMKGNCLLELKLHNEALKEFDEASSLSTDTELQVFLNLGCYYLEVRDYENASICFSEGKERCNTVNPDNRDELINTFSTCSLVAQIFKLWLEDDYLGALSIIEDVNPINSEIAYTKIILNGCTLYYLGRYEDSINCLKEVLGNDEYDLTSLGYTYIGCSYHKMGHYETALQYIDLGIEKGNDDDATGFVAKGDCHFHLGQYGDALESYRKAIGCLESDEEYTIPEIEEKIKAVKYVQAQDETEKEAKKRPTHITIQGNNTAPINIGGILATDDAIINRATIQKEEEEVITAFCPQCGCKVDAEDRFCRKCGGKLK